MAKPKFRVAIVLEAESSKSWDELAVTTLKHVLQTPNLSNIVLETFQVEELDYKKIDLTEV